MKVFRYGIFLLFMTSFILLPGESNIFSFKPDQKLLDLIKGKWQMKESKYLFNFTSEYACRVKGILFFYYRTTANTLDRYYVYTILKSPKTKRSYWIRGFFRNGTAHGFSTSRILFTNKDKLVVFRKNSQVDIYLEGTRVAEVVEKNSKNR